jgi:hypothetical protein
MLLRCIAGLALLQIALLGLLTGPGADDAYTLNDLRASLLGPKLEVGMTLPSLLVYDQGSARRVRFARQRRPTTLILSGCAVCNIHRVKGWLAGAAPRHERRVTILDTSPDQLRSLRARWQLEGEVYACRGSGTYPLLGVPMLPVEIRALPDGVVFGVDAPNRR